MKEIRHLIDAADLTVAEIDELIAVAEDIIKDKHKYSQKCKGKKLATLFFEPSTRTRLSFEAAMYELGGNVLGFSSASSSSTVKGETVMDTIRTVGSYADIIVMRHPLDGATFAGSLTSSVPVINAGDGGHCHPTQTLADLMTIYQKHQRLENLVIGICGDLKYGRTVHSLISAMVRYPKNKFVLISPPELAVPDYITRYMDKNNIEYIEVMTIEECISEVDVLYMTRVQKERFQDQTEYFRLKDFYILNKQKLADAKKNMIVLHPLPRVKEINIDVDSDPRACYFNQVENGKIIRMALIMKFLKEAKEGYINSVEEYIECDFNCKNSKCVTMFESDLKQLFMKNSQGECVCKYCETKV